MDDMSPGEVGEMTTPRETQVLEAVVTLVDSLLDDFDVVELLTQLTENCTRLLDIASAGLLLVDPLGRLHLMAATSDRPHDLELFQLQSDEGPCLDCYLTGQPVSVADLRIETSRWPAFVQAATDAGFVSVHALPMRAGRTVLGALGLFGTSAGELTQSDLTVGQALAHIASVAILQEHGPSETLVFPRLRGALASRVTVDQAKGVIRARFGVSVDDAFDLLRRYARVSAGHVTEISRALVGDRSVREQVLSGIDSMRSTRDA